MRTAKRDTRERSTRTRRNDAEKQTEPPRRVHRARERRAVDTRARATGGGGGGGGGARAGENANPPRRRATPRRSRPGSRLGPFPLRYTRRDSR